MDRDLKMPLWGAATGMPAPVRKAECSVDLKLGPKRVRTAGGAQKASCLVDGCRSDLGGCREYHRRHKVCEAHSKTPVVIVGGLQQRFCQQCSRFHLLVEFDEVKRSCRKRLDGHNRRRRKPQPESVSSAAVFLNSQGARFSPYPQIFPTTGADPTCPVAVKTEDDIFADALTHMFDSECALSLLSPPPRTSTVSFSQPPLPYSVGLGPRWYSLSHRGSTHASANMFSCSGMEDENVGSTVLVSDGRDAEMNCEGLFGVDGESSSNGGSQALHFSWR